MLRTGRVLAVSGASVTIGGDGPSVSPAVTGATTITGTIPRHRRLKVGNEESAQITGTASHLTTTAIQDPASIDAARTATMFHRGRYIRGRDRGSGLRGGRAGFTRLMGHAGKRWRSAWDAGMAWAEARTGLKPVAR